LVTRFYQHPHVGEVLAHRATAAKSDDPMLWRILATTYDIVGRADAAAAALAAIDSPTWAVGCRCIPGDVKNNDV
jgi:hypothetical protein